MSATLTWFNSGMATKTGTTSAALITDIANMVTAQAGNANFSWALASSSIAGTQFHVVCKPKGGGVGRILLVLFTSTPAAINTTLSDVVAGSLPLNQILVAFFPAGNVDSPSNINSASGTILGDDTGAVKFAAGMLASTYGASIAPFYFDSAEAIAFGFGNPASAAVHGFIVGYCLVDAADNAYAACIGIQGNNWVGFGSNAASVLPWTASATSAGSAAVYITTNYGAANRKYFTAWTPSGPWASGVVGPNDILTDTALNKAWFVPCPLVAQQVKGEGFVLKLRQIAYGPGAVGQFTPYNTTGPVVQARQFCSVTAGANGCPWMTNFKL